MSHTAGALKEVWETMDLKDELKLDLDRPGRYFWAGTEAGMLGAYGFMALPTKDACEQECGADMLTIRCGRSE